MDPSEAPKTSETLPLVERHLIRHDDARFAVLDAACWRAKNLYNAANYQVRQAFIFEQRRMSYREQEKRFKQGHLPEDQRLPAKVVQQVLMGLHQNWNSFEAAHAEYQVHPERFTGRPRLPGYKNKASGRCGLTFTDQAISRKALRQGRIVLSGLNVEVRTRQRQVDQVRVLPRSRHYVVEVVYTAPVQQVTLDERLYAAVDVGLNNLAALASNQPGFVPLLVNGRPLKSLNQYYNQCRAQAQCQLPDGQHTSRHLIDLTNARNRRIDSLLHLASRYLIEVLLRAGIGNLVIGKNDGWKQHIDLGKRTNQNFVSVPHARFVEMLTYKAQLVGIKVMVVEESYTSKCSFLDGEPVGKHEHYQGRRIRRGLFRAGDGRAINADLNGAYNILRKVAPDAFESVPALRCHGVRVNPRQMEKNLQTWRHNGVSGASRSAPLPGNPV